MQRVKNVWSIWKKEMLSYFLSPIAYVVIAIFLLVTGYFYNSILKLFIRFQFQRFMGMGGGLNLTDHFLRPLYSNMTIILLLISPILTMRLFAEEKKQGTFETLMTSPLTTTQIVMGKFLAALTVFVIMILLTAVYPIFLAIYSNPETGSIVTIYVGLFLLGCAFMSIGLFTSSLTENQIIAAVVAFGILLILWVIGWAATAASSNVADILKYISMMDHFGELAKGVLSTRTLVFFLSFTGFMLFLTISVIESHKWR